MGDVIASAVQRHALQQVFAFTYFLVDAATDYFAPVENYTPAHITQRDSGDRGLWNLHMNFSVLAGDAAGLVEEEHAEDSAGLADTGSTGGAS